MVCAQSKLCSSGRDLASAKKGADCREASMQDETFNFSFFAKFDVWPTLLELSTEGRERMLCGEQFLVCDET